MSKITLPVLVLFGAVASTFAACSSDDDGKNAGGGDQNGATDAGGDTGDIDGSEGPGDSGTDGEADSGDSASCRKEADAFAPCGGELIGTWDLDDLCEVTPIDVPGCPEFSGGMTTQYAPGYALTFDESVISLPETTRTVTLDASIPLTCAPELDLGDIEDCASMSGPETGTCTGDDICNCVGEEIDELPATTHAYSAQEDGTLSIDEEGTFEYCVQGQTLLLKGRALGEGGGGDSFVYVFTRR